MGILRNHLPPTAGLPREFALSPEATEALSGAAEVVEGGEPTGLAAVVGPADSANGQTLEEAWAALGPGGRAGLFTTARDAALELRPVPGWP